MSSSPHPITASQVTEADFRAASNVAYGCLSVLEDLGFASGDVGSLIYRPSLFTCDEFAMLPLDPGFSRITQDVSYLCQVLDYAGGLRPGPLAGHQVDWNDAQGPEKIGKVKPWLVQVAEGPAWRACTTAHEKAYHLALDLWLQIEGIVFSEVFDGGGEYEPGPGFHLKPGLVEENLTEIQERIKARPRLDHHAAKAEVERESAKALGAWKAERDEQRKPGWGNSAATNESRPDGPIPPDSFRWKDKEFGKLSPTPWELLNALWVAERRTLRIDEKLAKLVWKDENMPPECLAIGDARKAINAFFGGCRIPLRVEKKGRYVRLKDVPQEKPADSP